MVSSQALGLEVQHVISGPGTSPVGLAGSASYFHRSLGMTGRIFHAGLRNSHTTDGTRVPMDLLEQRDLLDVGQIEVVIDDFLPIPTPAQVLGLFEGLHGAAVYPGAAAVGRRAGTADVDLLS